MTASNQTPASQNTEIPSQLVAALEEIRMELVKADTLSGFNISWLKSAYDFGRDRASKSFQNALRILASRARFHLQCAKAIALHIKDQRPSIHWQIENIEAGSLILSSPVASLGPSEVLALMQISHDFRDNLKSCMSAVDRYVREVSPLDEKTDHVFDRDQVDFKDVDSLPSHDFDVAAKLDIAYACFQEAVSAITRNNKVFIDDPDYLHSVISQVIPGLRDVLPSCNDEEIASCVSNAINDLVFIEDVFQAKLINPESSEKYLHPIMAVLNTASELLGYAAECANEDRAKEILKSGGASDAGDIH